MTTPNPIVFLVDVDDTLLENDRIQDVGQFRLNPAPTAAPHFQVLPQGRP